MNLSEVMGKISDAIVPGWEKMVINIAIDASGIKPYITSTYKTISPVKFQCSYVRDNVIYPVDMQKLLDYITKVPGNLKPLDEILSTIPLQSVQADPRLNYDIKNEYLGTFMSSWWIECILKTGFELDINLKRNRFTIQYIPEETTLVNPFILFGDFSFPMTCNWIKANSYEDFLCRFLKAVPDKDQVYHFELTILNPSDRQIEDNDLEQKQNSNSVFNGWTTTPSVEYIFYVKDLSVAIHYQDPNYNDLVRLTSLMASRNKFIKGMLFTVNNLVEEGCIWDSLTYEALLSLLQSSIHRDLGLFGMYTAYEKK